MTGKNTRNTKERGQAAEQIAVDYLLKHGYRIIERNFHCKLGEIDIIAGHKGYLVFVEVRSRHSIASLNPVHSVDFRKQKKIIRAAEVYLAKHFEQAPLARFDVVIVTLGSPPNVELIPDAFSVETFGPVH